MGQFLKLIMLQSVFKRIINAWKVKLIRGRTSELIMTKLRFKFNDLISRDVWLFAIKGVLFTYKPIIIPFKDWINVTSSYDYSYNYIIK